MTTIIVLMTLEKETKGALRYSEVDKDGVKLEMQVACIGTLYLRKHNFPDGAYPQAIHVEVS